MGYAVSVSAGYVYESIGGAHLDSEISDWLNHHAPSAQMVRTASGYDVRFPDRAAADEFMFSFI